MFDRDLSIAVLIALVIVLVVAVGWPGYLRVRARHLAGFWASQAGVLYEIRPTGGRTFTVRSSDAASPETRGTVVGVRGVRVGVGQESRRGKMEIGGRRIAWDGSGIWSRQGVPLRKREPAASSQ